MEGTEREDLGWRYRFGTLSIELVGNGYDMITLGKNKEALDLD